MAAVDGRLAIEQKMSSTSGDVDAGCRAARRSVTAAAAATVVSANRIIGSGA